uniref:Uncharacterized protein n=1 Tax=Chromera velia CCMP2878 TaxID=1169474 RepID=A0A0K6SAT6_9ALVE|eukprot:Cvel_11062.t2-p1 / transcript=Cvel_11062.t2 / gene=Cvel_11062 / organism=Chromera_velia_CCMP2878 / gene_product=hypothetical protein / transcript_product=hypothetical protein / location=Cvel_scaffold682:56262-61298(+) / protein_length=322 / sequence_SO=supercontig / SO=protein_coding / is_pseudo=false
MERWGQGGGPKVHCGDAIAWISVHILFISGVEWTTLPHDGWKVRRLKPFTSGVIQTLTRKDLTAAEEERSRWEERSSEPSQMKGKGSPRGGKGKGRGRSKTKREGGGSPRKGGAGAAPGRIGTDGSVREFREVVSDEGLVTGCTCFRNPLEMESQSPLKTYREHLAELKECAFFGRPSVFRFAVSDLFLHVSFRFVHTQTFLPSMFFFTRFREESRRLDDAAKEKEREKEKTISGEGERPTSGISDAGQTRSTLGGGKGAASVPQTPKPKVPGADPLDLWSLRDDRHVPFPYSPHVLLRPMNVCAQCYKAFLRHVLPFSLPS